MKLRTKKEQILEVAKTIKDIKECIATVQLGKFDQLYQKQLLIDISGLIMFDSKSGISRVIKSQINILLKIAPKNLKIHTIYLKKIQERFAHYYLTDTYTPSKRDMPIACNKGDIIYTPDLAYEALDLAVVAGLYRRYAALGARIAFLVYDLLPITNKEFFVAGQEIKHQSWLDNITEIADTLICISNAVSQDLKEWIINNKPEKQNKIRIRVIHLGADLPNKQQTIVPRIKKETVKFLSVGTVEPRKAYMQLVNAFDILWQEHANLELHIVGKKGWLIEDLYQYITMHPYLNERLYYYPKADDSTLETLYTTLDVLIYPSYQEGFGLPLIEATFYHMPLLLRDIPIFKEIADNHAFYFKNTRDPQEIVDGIYHWLELYGQNKHPSSDGIKVLTWEQNMRLILKVLEEYSCTER